MKTKVDYLPLVHAMEYLVNYARSLKVKRENPEGDLQTYSISDIRICYLEHQNYSQSCLNGMSADQQTTGPISEMLITLYYNNSKKIVHFPFPVNSLFLQYPETMISLLIPHLTIAVDCLIQDFYASCTEDNKYHCYDSSDAVVQLEDAAFTIKPLGKVQKKQRIAFEQLVSECYTSQEVLMVSGDIQNSRKLWIVVDSFGRRIIEYQDIFHLYLELTLLNEQKHLFVDRFSRMYTSIDALLSDFPQTRAYCQGLLSSLQRQQLKSDIYPLILSSSAVGTLFHEALAGHMLSGLYIADELSMVFKDKIGSSIVKEGFMEVLKQLEIWDVPSDSSMIAHYRYDMEGTPAQDVCLIEYGEVRNYLLDRNSAAWLRMPNNGRALAGGFCSSKAYLDGFIDRAVEPEPRVSNLKILSQSELELQDLEQFYFEKYGYYLWVESYDGAVDVTTGTFNLYVNAITKVYADGHKEYFYGGKLSANLVDFLSAISLVTKSYGRSQGYCGSSSGSVPTEEYAPIMAAYGLNWVPNPLPQKMHILDIHRDKYFFKQGGMLYLRQSRYSALFFFNCKCGLNPYRLCCLYFSVMMRSFQDLARKNLSEKFQGYRMLGMLALKQVKRFFEISDPDEHIIAEEKITGYLRYTTLFIKTSDQKLKIEIFKQKKKLIESINQHFLSLGYQHRLTDLRLK